MLQYIKHTSGVSKEKLTSKTNFIDMFNQTTKIQYRKTALPSLVCTFAW